MVRKNHLLYSLVAGVMLVILKKIFKFWKNHLLYFLVAEVFNTIQTGYTNNVSINVSQLQNLYRNLRNNFTYVVYLAIFSLAEVPQMSNIWTVSAGRLFDAQISP